MIRRMVRTRRYGTRDRTAARSLVPPGRWCAGVRTVRDPRRPVGSPLLARSRPIALRAAKQDGRDREMPARSGDERNGAHTEHDGARSAELSLDGRGQLCRFDPHAGVVAAPFHGAAGSDEDEGVAGKVGVVTRAQCLVGA